MNATMTAETEHTVLPDPVGGLYLDAQKRAKKKANGHTSSADCGCAVTVSYFSEVSHSTKFERCWAHPKPGRK